MNPGPPEYKSSALPLGHACLPPIIYLRVNEISFSYERMYTKTRFKGEANDIRKWTIQRRNASAYALPRTLKCAEVITSIKVVPSPLGQPRPDWCIFSKREMANSLGPVGQILQGKIKSKI